MKDKIDKVQIIITPRSVFWVVAVLLFLALVYKLTAILYIFFIAFSIYSSLKPIINSLEKNNKFPKTVSIPLILISFLSFITVLVVLVIQNISLELKNIDLEQLVNNFVKVIEGFIPIVNTSELNDNTARTEGVTGVGTFDPSGLFENRIFIGSSSIILRLLSSTAGVVLSVFSIFVVVYYMLLKKGNIFDGILKFVPDKCLRSTIRKYIAKVESKLGSWIMSQFILMLLIGILSYIGVALPMVYFDTDAYPIGKFAVTLAVISGILEVVPNIGPIITFLISIFLSIALGGDLVVPQTLYIAALFILVQQVEAAMIVPNVMKQAVGLDPIVTILGVMAGGILAGPIGAVLIIPVIATVQIVIEFLVNEEEILGPDAPKISDSC